MQKLTQAVVLGCVLLGAVGLAEARVLLGEARVNQEGEVIGTILNEGINDIKTDSIGFPSPIEPQRYLDFKIKQPEVGQRLDVVYKDENGKGCIFFFDTISSPYSDEKITLISAQPLHIKEYCYNAGYGVGNHLGVATDMPVKNKMQK